MCDTNIVILRVIVQCIRGDKRDVTSARLLVMPTMYDGLYEKERKRKKKTQGEGQRLQKSGKMSENNFRLCARWLQTPAQTKPWVKVSAPMSVSKCVCVFNLLFMLLLLFASH